MRPVIAILAVVVCFHFALCSADAQISPVYTSHFADDTVTGSKFKSMGSLHWFVAPGADIYSADDYERPTNQTYDNYDGKFATEGDYFGNLDIAEGFFGYDSEFVYVRIKMVDTRLHTKSGELKDEGLIYDYRFRLNTDASGVKGYLFTADQPGSLGTAFHTEKNFGFQDKDGDLDRSGNGYEAGIISDGKLASNGKTVLYSRIDPADSSAIEFALDYRVLGFNPATISSIVFEANKGLKDNGNYPWNKKYSPSQAGSPNPGSAGKSEFGTSGLQNVYELDTLRGVPTGGAVPGETDVRPPTGSLFIERDSYLQGVKIPVKFQIVR